MPTTGNTFGTINKNKTVNPVSVDKVIPQPFDNKNLPSGLRQKLESNNGILGLGNNGSIQEVETQESKLDLSFGSVKVGEQPPESVVNLLRKLNIDYSISTDSISHIKNAKILTIFRGNGDTVMINLEKQEVLTSLSGNKKELGVVDTSLEGEDTDNEPQNPFNFAQGFSPDNLKKIYEQNDTTLDSNTPLTKNIEDRMSEIDAEFRSLMPNKDDASKARRLELMREKETLRKKILEQKVVTPEINKEDQEIENDWSFGKKYIADKEGVVSSEDAIRQEYQELSNKVSAEGYTEEERESFLEKGIALEKVLNQAKEVGPAVSLEAKIKNAQLPDLMKVIEQAGGIRRGGDFFTAKEIQERIAQFFQGKGDIRDIPETDGLRQRIVELKQIRDQENMVIGINPENQVNKNDKYARAETIPFEDVTESKESSGLEKKSTDLPEMDESAVIAQEQNQKRSEQEMLQRQAQEQQMLRLEQLKNSLDQARQKYALEQEKYNQQKYVDRFSAKLKNIFGNYSDITQEKFNAERDYQKVKEEYYKELARVKIPLASIVEIMKDEQQKLAEALPLKKREKLAKFAGALGLGVIKGFGTIANTYTQGTEYLLKKAGIQEDTAKTAAKWIGRGLFFSTLTVATGGAGALTGKALLTGAAAMATAETLDWAVLKRIFKNDTEEKVIKNTLDQYQNLDLTEGANIRSLDKKIGNRKLRANLELALRTALKIGTGFGVGMGINAMTAPTVVEAAPNDMQIGKIEEDIGIRPEAVPGGTEIISSDAFVKTGEGVTHPILRQLQADPELARAFGIEGAPTGADAARVAEKFGYIDSSGAEVRVFDGNNAAYQIDLDSAGNPVMKEYANGILIETKSLGSAFEGAGIEGSEYLQNSNSSTNIVNQSDQLTQRVFQPEEVTRFEPIQSTVTGLEPDIPKSLNPFIDGSAPFDPNNTALNKELLAQKYPNATPDQLTKLAEGVKNLYAQGVTTSPDQLFAPPQDTVPVVNTQTPVEAVPTTPQQMAPTTPGRINPGDMFAQ